MNKRILTFLLVLSYAMLYGTQPTAERLLIRLPSITNDSAKVNLLNRISWEFHRNDPELTKYYAERSRILAEWINYEEGLARALNLMGIYHYLQADLEKMKAYNQFSLNIAKRSQDLIGQQNALNDLGVYYHDIGEIEVALELLHESLKIAKELQNEEIQTIILYNIHSLYTELGEQERSRFYLEELKSLAGKAKQGFAKIAIYKSLASHYFDKNEMQQASSNFQKMYLLAGELDDQISKGNALIGLAKVQYYRGHQELAMIQLKRALKIFEEHNQTLSVINVKLEIADIFLQSGEPENVTKLLDDLLIEYEDLISKITLDKIYDLQWKAYSKTEKYREALESSQRHKKIHDELYNLESAKQIAVFETKHKTQHELVENRLLRVQKMKTEAEMRQRFMLFVGSMILLALSLIALFLLRRISENYAKQESVLTDMVKARTNELYISNIQLKQSNEELEKFAYIASHDLKEPLRNIVGFSNLLERRLRQYEMSNEASEEYLNFIQDNAKQMYMLIEDVLEFSRVSKDISSNEFVNLNDIIESVKANLSTQMEERNAIVQYSDLPELRASSTRLFIVIKNLIENGIKYNVSDQVIIKIESLVRGDRFILSVEDNGIGIDREYHNKIFEMFERLHSKNEFTGTGLGLTICKKIIQHMGGELEVVSELDKGSKFSVVLPKAYLKTTGSEIKIPTQKDNSSEQLLEKV